MSTQNGYFEESLEKELIDAGRDPEVVQLQIDTFKKGASFQKLDKPCSIGEGVQTVDDDLGRLCAVYDGRAADKKIIKFVPASGAASRMFKELQSTLSGGEVTLKALKEALEAGEKEASTALKFIESIKRFAFYSKLKESLSGRGIDIDALLDGEDVSELIRATLTEPGLNYSNLPKGLIKFHLYGDYPRTAFEEHMVEADHYAKGSGGESRLHFTVSPEHLEEVKSLVSETIHLYQLDGSKLDISYSAQKPETDTVAVDLDNKPFVGSDGKVLFRPGGHGALIENLNDLDCDIVFIKNIDNVVPDRIKEDTYTYKKALGGYLLELEDKVFALISYLDKGYQEEAVNESLRELSQMGLDIKLPEFLSDATETEKAMYVRAKLMSPIRVCGVVRNEGEPGGGPFWVKAIDGTLSKQIVESSQVDMTDPEQKAVWESSTHFNPVDIVCSVRDYRGNLFDLTQYIDKDSGFISAKSSGGRDLKALELPGLWNGAMAYWNTVFVEVPLITFNPVKTVLDLLRPEHQNP